MSKILKKKRAFVDVVASTRKISVRYGDGINDFELVPFYDGCSVGDEGYLCYVEYSKSMCVWEFHVKPKRAK